MTAIRLLVTSGSSRRGSLNRRLAAVATGVAREAGAAVTELDLRDLGLPLYDGDIEAAGLPAGALELRRLAASHDALLIASPEYNAFPPPLLLNSFDWVSRVPPSDGLPSGLAATGRLVAGLLSASPGKLGGARSLMALRTFLSLNLGIWVVPSQFALAQAAKAFDDRGALLDARQHESVAQVVGALLHGATALRVPAP